MVPGFALARTLPIWSVVAPTLVFEIAPASSSGTI